MIIFIDIKLQSLLSVKYATKFIGMCVIIKSIFNNAMKKRKHIMSDKDTKLKKRK